MNDRRAQDDQDVWEAACTQLLREWVVAREPAWLPLNGRSMAPFLPGGSKILVSRTAAGQIGWGDLLVYGVEGRLVCHRVLRRRGKGGRHLFLTKGDGRRTIESWVAEEQVLGRVLRVEREGRLVDLNTPIRRLQAVAIAAASLVIIGGRALFRWGKQQVTGRGTWARTS
ncbi:MAG TPA: S26 family signal peptidase [Candidatus Acidoferrum sp.]|nr:S26 family signal peptidase [Candidatus Acidoferrum sp.]